MRRLQIFKLFVTPAGLSKPTVTRNNKLARIEKISALSQTIFQSRQAAVSHALISLSNTTDANTVAQVNPNRCLEETLEIWLSHHLSCDVVWCVIEKALIRFIANARVNGGVRAVREKL